MSENKNIPKNPIADEFGLGIFVGKGSIGGLHSFNKIDLATFHKVEQSHRDDYYLFFLQEEGTSTIEIDFQKYEVQPYTLTYIYPNQVHRMIAFENATVSFLAIKSEHINPEYLKSLEEIAPAKPMTLENNVFLILSEVVEQCIKLSERTYEKLYKPLLKDSCNALIGLFASQFLNQLKPNETLSRYEIITKAFKAVLESNFTTAKNPSEYAEKLNISTPYLNECVKNTTGFSTTHHIQQRVVLEAKRLLYHSNKSIKEIATELGYDDFPYFSRFFTKTTGTTALAFRNKNLD